MIQGNAHREVRFKDGHIIAKGDMLFILWPDPNQKPTEVEVLHRTKVLVCHARTALGWMGRSVTENCLSDALMDGTCETPNGHSVEPDGVDYEGAPSWLRIHGLI